jgi:hypothetical protein
VAQTASLAVAREGDLLIRIVPGVVGPRYVRNVPIGSESLTIGESPTLSKTRETDARNLSVKRDFSLISNIPFSPSIIDGDGGLKSGHVGGVER